MSDQHEPPPDIVWHRGNDGLLAHRVVLDARKLNPARLINRSGRHKGMQLVAKDDVRAWIELPRMTALKGSQTR